MSGRPRPWAGLLLLALWSSWVFALQGLAASTPGLRPWTPDLGVVLLLALEPRLPAARAFLAVAVVAAARIAFSVDPPLAIFVGYAGLFGLAVRLRRVLEIDRALPRALLAGVAAIVLALYWSLVRTRSLAAAGAGALPTELLDPRLTLGLATAIACVFLSPWFRRLPGLSLLGGRRP